MVIMKSRGKPDPNDIAFIIILSYIYSERVKFFSVSSLAYKSKWNRKPRLF